MKKQLYQITKGGFPMKLYTKEISKWAFRAYIAWSICADLIILGGILYLLFR